MTTPEHGAGAAAILRVHTSVMPFDDRPHDRQSHSQPLVLRREEGLEEPLLRVERQARTIVMNRDLRGAVARCRAHAHPSVRAHSRRRVERVEREIDDDLLQLDGITTT